MTGEFLNAGELLNGARFRVIYWLIMEKFDFSRFLNSSTRASSRVWGSPVDSYLDTPIEKLRDLRNIYLYINYQSLSAAAGSLSFLEDFEEFDLVSALCHGFFYPSVSPLGFGRLLRPWPDLAFAPTARTLRRS